MKSDFKLFDDLLCLFLRKIGVFRETFIEYGQALSNDLYREPTTYRCCLFESIQETQSNQTVEKHDPKEFFPRNFRLLLFLVSPSINQSFSIQIALHVSFVFTSSSFNLWYYPPTFCPMFLGPHSTTASNRTVQKVWKLSGKALSSSVQSA